MNRIPILAGGAVLAFLVLCGSTVANALITTPVSQVLQIAGVSITSSATPSSIPTADSAAAPSASASTAPGVDPGVTVVTPADPTKIGQSAAKRIDGKGCRHVPKHSSADSSDDPSQDPSDAATADPSDSRGAQGSHHHHHHHHHHSTGTPVSRDPDSTGAPTDSSDSTWSDSHNGTDGAWRHGGGTGGSGDGSGDGGMGTGQN